MKIGYCNIKTNILFGNLKCRPDPENPYYELLDFQSNFILTEKMNELRDKELDMIERISHEYPGSFVTVPKDQEIDVEDDYEIEEGELDLEGSGEVEVGRKKTKQVRKARLHESDLEYEDEHDEYSEGRKMQTG